MLKPTLRLYRSAPLAQPEGSHWGLGRLRPSVAGPPPTLVLHSTDPHVITGLAAAVLLGGPEEGGSKVQLSATLGTRLQLGLSISHGSVTWHSIFQTVRVGVGAPPDPGFLCPPSPAAASSPVTTDPVCVKVTDR